MCAKENLQHWLSRDGLEGELFGVLTAENRLFICTRKNTKKTGKFKNTMNQTRVKEKKLLVLIDLMFVLYWDHAKP